MNDAFAQTTPGVHVCNNNPVVLPGDMNCDGVVNLADVDPFVLALVNPAAYALAFPGCDVLAGDMNGDGLLNGLDVGLFVAAL